MKPPRRTKTATPADIQAEAVKTILGFKTELLKKGKGPGTPEMAVAERLLRAIKSLPAYDLAETAVREIGETGLPAAVIRKLAGGKEKV